MTSVDAAVIAGLDPRTCAPDLLRTLIGHQDAALRLLGLRCLADRLDAGVDTDPAAYATSLPSTPDGSLPGAPDAAPDAAPGGSLYGSPDAALALARVHLHLRAHVRAWPEWRTADLPVPVQIAWLRAEIAYRPRTLRDEAAGELLYQAVRGLPADPALAGELARRRDPVLRAEAFRVTREALHASALSPSRARALVEDLADDVPDALRELAEPWAALDPLPDERLARYLSTGPGAAAIEVAARHGRRRPLLAVAADPARPPALRRRALELLGDLATREDVGAIVAIAVQDPLLLAGPAVECLTGAHRRGHFPSGPDVSAIIGLALADHRVPAEEVATVLYSARHEAVRELAGEPGPRHLELLVALDAQGAPDLDVGAVLRPLAGNPAPYLRAVRDLRHLPAEEDALALLPAAPREALDALEAVGGPRTAEALREGLGLEGGGIVAHLRPHRHRALEILWHLTGDAEGRRSLLERLDPRDLPRRVADDLGGPDARELALLRAGLDPDDPAHALRVLARNGDASTLPAIADLLLRLASDGGLPSGGPAPDRLNGGDVSPEAVEAIRELGARLFRRGAIRPRCLLDAASPKEAGNALLASLLLDLLDRPGLTPPEQAALLDLLLRAPYRRAKARVHRLLRHRDPRVRGGAIAVIARDAGDTRTMSASLIPLTRADDVETVRQALLALGTARAGWAAPAIAACLDHRNMNVKKTAASALARAGAPSAVPKLLYWLGHHDNPGFRDALTGALRAILGEAFTATVTAAADHATDERGRSLLRAALGAANRPAPGDAALAAETLARDGWNPETARRLVAAHERDPRARPDPRTRPLLAHWLDLAASDDPGPVLRLVLRMAPPSWADTELEVFARSAPLLLDALTVIGEGHRPALLALLDRTVPRLRPQGRWDLAERIRGLPLGRTGLVLLRRCGTVLTQDDLDHALATADDQEAVLREAFSQPRLEPSPWHRSLREATRDLDSLTRERARTEGMRERAQVGDTPEQARTEGTCERTRPEGTSRERLDALIVAFPTAPAAVRDALLAWMLDLQPLDAPSWTLAEEAHRPAPDPRTPRPADLDQPRSTAQRARLLAMLDDPSPHRRETAARHLLDWPEPDVREALFRACLDGRIDLPVPAGADVPEDDERLLGLAAHLNDADLEPLLPALVSQWENGSPAVRAAAGRLVHRVSPDLVADALAPRLETGAWGLLDLLLDRSLLRTPALTHAVRRLRAEGRDALADKILLVDGPLRDPGATAADEAALAAVREHHPDLTREPSRAELFVQARGGDPKDLRKALARLAETPVDDEFKELLAELITHPETKVRLHAHRVSRRVLDHSEYLRQTTRLLDDPEPDVIRSAVRTLSHASHEPAVPGLVALLAHPHRLVRRSAAEGLLLLGEPAVPALRHAAARARPDRRHRYTFLLDHITAP